jgi:hypothetical protein
VNVDRVYAEAIRHKLARGYSNLFLPRDRTIPILRASSVRLTRADHLSPRLLEEAAIAVLRTYVDRFARVSYRQFESRRLKPVSLTLAEARAPYVVRLTSNSNLVERIQALLKNRRLLYRDGDEPLPRLHLDRGLFTPFLLDPGDHGLEDVTVSPRGLRKQGEEKFLWDLREFWHDHSSQSPFHNVDLYVLRNLPRVGIGFFRSSGFFPDFVLWLVRKRPRMIRVIFIEPHGLHHGGLSGNRDKIDAFVELRTFGEHESFARARVTVGGYLLTETAPKDIPGAEHLTWERLEQDHAILPQTGSYVQRILRLHSGDDSAASY